MEDIVYNFCLVDKNKKSKNGKYKEIKVGPDFKKLQKLDEFTALKKDKEDLIKSLGIEIKENDKYDIYIKKETHKRGPKRTFSIIYNNPFVIEYIKQTQYKARMDFDFQYTLHKFLNAVKKFSVKSKNQDYLLNPKNVEITLPDSKKVKLNLYEQKSLKLPCKLNRLFKNYSDRKKELVAHPNSYWLQKEFNEDNPEGKLNHEILSNYESFHNVITWVNNYRKAKEKEFEKIRNNKKEMEEKERTEEIKRLKKIKEQINKTNYGEQLIFPGIDIYHNDKYKKGRKDRIK